MKLDFDAMLRMAKTDPDEFEILRRKIVYREIRKYCKSATELWVKRGWWTRVELEMSKSNNAIGRMITASRKMNMKLIELNNQLRRFAE